MQKYQIKAYCKINLFLKIVKKINNNYHNIKSLITFCNLYDVITLSITRGATDKIIFSGKCSSGINKDKNSITHVLKLLRKRKLIKNTKFKINVKKNIPHGSGLGGGSSNAASLLNFIVSKISLNIKKKEIKKIAREIGFDVPIMLEKKNTFLTGKKNEILRINRKFSLNILIVYPNFVCSTKKIYSFNKNLIYSKIQPKFDLKDKKKLINFLKKECNDLEKTAVKLYPKIKKLINLISMQNGCYFSRITGSGSACIGIFSNARSAIYTQKLIKLKFPKYWCAVSKTI